MIGTLRSQLFAAQQAGKPLRGFDCNTTVGLVHGQKMRRADFRFVMRYVRRSEWHSFDVTANEIANLLRADLAVGVVQHVAPPGWRPTKRLGRVYGHVAAEEAGGAGYALGSTLWCDLEGVSSQSSKSEIIDFCNAWYDEAIAAGYRAGLYAGWDCGLTPDELYYRLRFKAYWSAYNLADYWASLEMRASEPSVRGAQLLQREARVADRVPGIPFSFDVNELHVDKKGELPVFMLPPLAG